MKLITRQTLASEAAQKWAKQYPSPQSLGYRAGIQEKLEALGPTPDPDEVDEIIGNGSWTRLYSCDECKTDEVPVVQLGEELDYENRTTYICETCLRKALDLIQENQP